jgi:cell division septum initiation protein DivIVA
MRQRIEQLEQQIKAYENTKTSPCNEEEPQQKITAQASKIQILI